VPGEKMVAWRKDFDERLAHQTCKVATLPSVLAVDAMAVTMAPP